MDWRQIEVSLANEDVQAMSDALLNLQLNGSSKQASQSIIESALDKLDHHDVVIRSGAISVLSQSVTSNNPVIADFMGDVCKMIATPNLLDVKAGREYNEEYVLLHKNLCNMIAELQRKHMEQLMPYFKPVGAYLVNCTGNESRVVAMAACEYWAQLQVPPVANKLMDMWVPAILSKLAKLIPSLLRCMKYHDEHVKYLEHNTQDTDGRETPISMEEYTNLRNYAALGLETICRLFQTEAIIIIKPLIEKWLKSSNWKDVEAMILAFGALTEAVGTPREMADVYPKVMAKLLECYSHPKPLVRSITCFTLQHFIIIDPKVLSIKDPYTKMLKCTLNLMSDYNREVQEMAVQCLSAMLAYSNKDIQPYSKKLIDELIKADGLLKGRARFTYYECISHVFGHLGPLLEEGQVARLMWPLMEEWRELKHTAKKREDTILLCQPLCVVAIYAKASFAPFNDDIFKKVMPYMEHICEQNDIGTENVTTHTVAYLDILSAMYEGQGSSMATYVARYQLARHLVRVLQESNFQPHVHQSGLALLGHICQHSYSHIHPHLDVILDILNKHIDSKMSGIQNNVLWSLNHIAIGCPDANNKMLNMAEKLTKILLKHKIEEGIAINAALALTAMGQRWPSNLADSILKDDILMLLCALLQRPFPRNLEKITMFFNLCVIIKGDMSKVSGNAWVQFCISAAVLDCHDSQLSQKLKTLLRDLRMKLGNNGWSKLTQNIGSQLSYALRKKYKLY